jgi:NAD(P)-dependent dehydrogenase (short-subunit alcohol dehydrogenase family)
VPLAVQPAAATERDGVVIEYLRNMRSMIAAQRDVMLAYLGATPAPMIDVEARPVIEAVAAPAAIAAAPAAPVSATVDLMQLVTSIVSERTGYPVEMLGVDLDLEADLSIDSIKRIEIIGELAQRLGMRVDSDTDQTDAIVEELATRKTLRELVAWLTERLAEKSPASAPEKSALPPSELEEIMTTPATAAEILRYTLEVRPAPTDRDGTATVAGKRVVICDGGDAGKQLGARLRGEGADVRHVEPGDPIGEAEAFIDLAVVDGVTSMRGMFERVREAAIGGAKQILVATMHGDLGRAGVGGPAGLVKTLAAEWPSIVARVVHLDPDSDVAALLHTELHALDHTIEVGYVDGRRSCLEIVPSQVHDDGQLQLDAESVVLVTGGARGITARAAIAMAQRYGCYIELVGRSPLPDADEDPELARATDARALRALLGTIASTPAEIEARCAHLLAAREIRATLAALGDRGTYRVCDVRTPAFGALIDDIYARRGRIDGVIHGAGILEDKLMRHKTSESFERVFATKLAAAQTLVEHLRDDVKLVVLFSSISGAFGNRGQADYAAAGDALDKLAWSLQRRIAGRVVSIDWGPWSGSGMAVDLEREFSRRGIGLIDPQRGVEALLAELDGGRDAQVILTATDPRQLVRGRGAHA